MNIFKIMNDNVEKTFNSWMKFGDKFFQTFLTNDLFLKAAGKLLSGYNEMQARQRKQLAEILKRLGIPLRDDISDLAGIVKQVDSKLGEIELSLEEMKKQISQWAGNGGGKAVAGKQGSSRSKGKGKR